MKARDNPFSPSRLERALAFDPALIGTTWQELETRWHLLGNRAAITGRPGAGKTSLLNAWARRLAKEGRPFVHLFFNAERNRLDTTDRSALADCRGKILLVDGDCHLPWTDHRELRRASNAASGVLVARHRRGPWPELIRLKPDLELAGRLLERAAPDLYPRFQDSLPTRLRGLHSNLRDLWLDCYDELARR